VAEFDPIQTSDPYLGRCSALARCGVGLAGGTGRGSSSSRSAACICEAFFLKAPGENDVKNTTTKLAVLL
jgi:hypothetical protein